MAGYLCMPLKSNIPNPSDKSYRLVKCPLCGSECWESDLTLQVKEMLKDAVAVCTECALKKGAKVNESL